jgi:diadenosine tetraphosphatase ApaH/serine/threonine PP2A family protein phosphatase
MRVAVLSDIHSNLVALDAVLEDLGTVDAIWVLGDIVGYGPDPDVVVARLRDLDVVAVRGNHDAAALGQLDTSTFNDDARRAVEWTGETLAEETRAWLDALPEKREVDGFTLVHGSPRDPLWEYLFSVQVAKRNLSAFTTPHCLVGHTHVPLVFREVAAGDIETLAPSHGSELPIDAQRLILNPGGVGQPRDGDPRACAMVIDTEVGLAEWRRIPYAIERTQARMREVGLPVRLVNRLAHGV